MIDKETNKCKDNINIDNVKTNQIINNKQKCKDKLINIRISVKTRDKLKQYCKDNNTTITDLFLNYVKTLICKDKINNNVKTKNRIVKTNNKERKDINPNVKTDNTKLNKLNNTDSELNIFN